VDEVSQASARGPAVSVIMANYNGARFLGAAIASLRAQTLPDWELIVVDDASSDGSPQIVQAAIAADPRVRLIRQAERSGPGAARNLGLEAATGDWIAIADSDDLMAPERLARLLEFAARDGAQIVADNQVLFWDGEPRRKLYLSERQLPQPRWIDFGDFVLSNSLGARLPPLGFIKPLIARELIGAQGIRYDPRLKIGEDFDFVARLLVGGTRIRLDSAAYYFYRKHPHSTSHRYSPEPLEALLAADQRFRAEFPSLSPADRQALDARRRSLEILLDWEHLVAHLKARRLAPAVSLGLRNPALWPMLTEPLAARLSRLGRKRPAAIAPGAGAETLA
jgi:succinoglycan biosynthesis protein ExoO